jgi:Spy/CpxP family protein refolding chaperone
MKRTRKFAITGAAIVSAAALAIGGSVAASADDGDGKQHGKDGKGGGALTSLVEDGTLTESDVTAIRDAMKAAHEGDKEARQAERAAAKAEILADLVADGTLTQSQADSISSAEKGGMRELIANGTIDREDVQALRAAMREGSAGDRAAKQAERAAERDAVLDALVADGTLTQSQADAVESAIAAKQAQQGERGKGKQAKWGNKGEGKRSGERGMSGARA